ncbi:hypothetical protein O7626_40325 [Micromonospora sp. WMMD1102]|uniref:hypothetical protein n=1 Tax=Micromonospora sp. WMMD1102 TaxID=3016105 RepID=UPI00241560C0|nr:hypothetical protein [Micromonospora sp. WMMD1102]MDG4792065.1 hypothetical protein [Micromonospora sp. WMMD1102]
MSNPIPSTVEGYAAETLRRHIERAADELEQLAVSLRSRAGSVGVESGSYSSTAASVQRSVTSAVAALCLDTLTPIAAEADVARARGE